jgi:hypothetical protein
LEIGHLVPLYVQGVHVIRLEFQLAVLKLFDLAGQSVSVQKNDYIRPGCSADWFRQQQPYGKHCKVFPQFGSDLDAHSVGGDNGRRFAEADRASMPDPERELKG